MLRFGKRQSYNEGIINIYSLVLIHICRFFKIFIWRYLIIDTKYIKIETIFKVPSNIKELLSFPSSLIIKCGKITTPSLSQIIHK